METSATTPAPDAAQGSFLTPTSGSGLKHRIRELECIIDSELKALQKQVQQLKSQKIVQVSAGLEAFVGSGGIAGVANASALRSRVPSGKQLPPSVLPSLCGLLCLRPFVDRAHGRSRARS